MKVKECVSLKRNRIHIPSLTEFSHEIEAVKGPPLIYSTVKWKCGVWIMLIILKTMVFLQDYLPFDVISFMSSQCDSQLVWWDVVDVCDSSPWLVTDHPCIYRFTRKNLSHDVLYMIFVRSMMLMFMTFISYCDLSRMLKHALVVIASEENEHPDPDLMIMICVRNLLKFFFDSSWGSLGCFITDFTLVSWLEESIPHFLDGDWEQVCCLSYCL